METKTTKNIKIYVEEKETTVDGKKKKFNVYHTFTKNGRKMQVKFRKDVTNLPTEKCTAVIDVNEMNVDKNSQFPVLWVSKVEEYIPFVTDEDMAKNKAKLDDLFD